MLFNIIFLPLMTHLLVIRAWISRASSIDDDKAVSYKLQSIPIVTRTLGWSFRHRSELEI